MAEALAVGAAANIETLKSELAKSIKQFEDLGENPDDMKRVKDLRAALANASAGTSEHENQVFSHLLAFFSRYFDKGDFISQRRYKGDTYAYGTPGDTEYLRRSGKLYGHLQGLSERGRHYAER